MSDVGQPTERAPGPPGPSGKKRSRAKVVLPALFGGALIVGGGIYIAGLGKESTDDAFVEGHVANVAARVPGMVSRVLCKDNQEVAAGAVLVELDDRDAKARLLAAEADLGSAKAALAAAEAQLAFTTRNVVAGVRQAKGGVSQAWALSGSSKAGIDQAKADLDAVQSRKSLAELDLRRTRKLFADGSIGRAELDARESAYTQAAAALEQTRARLTSAQVGLTNAAGSIETAQGRLLAASTGPQQVDMARAQVGVAKARVAQAEAAHEQARLNLSYMVIRAPMRGVVSRRTVEPGQMVDPARPLLSLTNLDEIWVVANFKEDQLAEMRAGQRVRIRFDTYGRRNVSGHVDSLAGGTGSRFALLPPDNASGNFTKVVQRLPVLIHLDERPSGMLLRPGLSAYVTVWTSGSPAGSRARAGGDERSKEGRGSEAEGGRGAGVGR
jgi:membrane fusion protein, multidrug efflux system